MSYPVDSTLDVLYDSARMREEVNSFDTLQQVDVNNRIELQQLETQKRLEEYNLKYYKLGFLTNCFCFRKL